MELRIFVLGSFPQLLMNRVNKPFCRAPGQPRAFLRRVPMLRDVSGIRAGRGGLLVQIIVYILIGLGALGTGAAAYFGFTFTPIEAALAAAMFYVVAFVIMERRLRRRAETRLELAIDELSRLLSTDAQAGAVLSKRINVLVEANLGKRMDGLEADISVLGTVVRQVTETVAEIDATRRGEPPPPSPFEDDLMAVLPFEPGAPARISPDELEAALDEGRLACHVLPIVGLPQRRARAHDMVPRLVLGEAEFVEAGAFLPQGRADLVRRIERRLAEEAFSLLGRIGAFGQPLPISVPISRATLDDTESLAWLASSLDADRRLASTMSLVMPEPEWRALSPHNRAALATLLDRGAALALSEVTSLRVDFSWLATQGVRSVRLDAAAFLAGPQVFTDFLSSDIAAYLKRFEVELVFTGVANEQQIIALLEDGLTSVAGPHIGGPAAPRPDLMVDRSGPLTASAPLAPLRRAER
jgi:cyclic-di-GMP phosphodiesterase TipF (flagellum assembly factor)